MLLCQVHSLVHSRGQGFQQTDALVLTNEPSEHIRQTGLKNSKNNNSQDLQNHKQNKYMKTTMRQHLAGKGKLPNSYLLQVSQN